MRSKMVAAFVSLRVPEEGEERGRARAKARAKAKASASESKRGERGRERERGRGRELWRGEGEGKGASFLGRRPAGRREERRDVSLKLHPPNMSGPLDAGHPKLLASIQNRGQGPSHLHQLNPTPLCPTVAAVLSPRNE